MRDASFSVTGGAVLKARRLDGRSDLWEIEIMPSMTGDLVIVLPATEDCAAAGAVCTDDGRPLSNRLEGTVPVLQPEISVVALASPLPEGTTAEFEVSRTGSTSDDLYVYLDAEVTGSDPIRGHRVRFFGQRSVGLVVEGPDDDEVMESMSAVLTLMPGEGYTASDSAGSAQVVWEDDDTRTAAAPLTASFSFLPSSHAGSGTVKPRILFSEPISISYVTMRDESFDVTGGEVRNARRVDQRNDLWELEIAPSSDADVVIVLPATEDCSAVGAVCTADGKALSNRLEETTPGPSG